MLAYLLLQDRSDMGVGGIGGQSEYRPGQGVRQVRRGLPWRRRKRFPFLTYKEGSWGYLRVRR